MPNDTVSTLTYDAGGNVTSIVHTSDVGQTIGSYSYSYDATGRRLGAVENGTTISYTYDAIYRLTDATHSNGNLYHYEYDAAGNRLLKQEPSETVAYTYDIANQLTHVGGTPTTLDGNGNLLSDGSRSYAYDDLDRLIQVTQGITSTQYGYTGDGDRLWQQTDGVTTTFTLDLNGALAQVLAQSQGSAATTTSFLPGIGQQQGGDYWTYFHTDALGSVRDLSGATGNAMGHVDYSPFGEIVNSTGMASWFGFTGEQQDGSSGLTYLRARYYDPANGRFLTPDSLIPDITNGQTLNAYAYVYNDPINLVDPSGHMGIGDVIVWGALNAPDSWKPGIKQFSQDRLSGLNWWYSKPEKCDCDNRAQISGYGPSAGIIAQTTLGYNTSPVGRYGTYTIYGDFGARTANWWRRIPGMQSGLVNKILPKHWGYSTVWEEWVVSTGWIDDIAPANHHANGLYELGGPQVRARTSAGVKLKNGLKGFWGAALLAGVVDGVVQGISDWNHCLSRAERLFRVCVATAVGIAGGLIASAAFGVGALVASLPILGISATGAFLIPFLASLGAGLWSGIGGNYIKEEYIFDVFPR